MEKCKECSLNTLRTSSRGTRSRTGTNVITHSPCDLHTDGTCVRSKGCAVNAPKVKLFLASALNRLKDYKKKGSIQLLPSEVRRIQDPYCASSREFCFRSTVLDYGNYGYQAISLD